MEERVDRIGGLVARLGERCGGESTSGSTERISFFPVLYVGFDSNYCLFFHFA